MLTAPCPDNDGQGGRFEPTDKRPAIGLRVCQRKSGWRLAKATPLKLITQICD